LAILKKFKAFDLKNAAKLIYLDKTQAAALLLPLKEGIFKRGK